ncbi:hypothetical protein [Pseudozobellia sp. WGM2]|uniref:hypothetical protein n=1 Tax=Pseudozobellia sp. WGM2 TaxID=2787625 RepID=UPI001ADFBAE6|nr:hypothetical protein [Pseudozobellia sp. WGM2]
MSCLKTTYISSFACILWFLASCSSENVEEQPLDAASKEEEIVEEVENESLLSFTINGETRTTRAGKPFAAFIEITTENGKEYAFGISGADSNDDLERWGFSTSFSSADSDFIVEGITVSSAESNFEDLNISGAYEDSLVRIPENEVLLTAKFNEDLFYHFQIIEINEENQMVSGTFSMDLLDIESNEIMEIRDGIFTNAEYIQEVIEPN